MKKEFFIKDVLCSIAIVCFLFVVCAGMFVQEKNEAILVSANSEYNGTIYAGDKTSKNVSLMVNVYWGNEHLEKMFEIFEKNNVKTTFFVGGSWARDNSDLLKKIYDAGHEIANHGTNHKEHGKISYEQNLTEIQTCHEIVKHILGVNMELFAPPGGSYSKHTTKASGDLGYKTIMWTRDTIDWRDKNTQLILNRATTNMSGGDLILMHPTSFTVDALQGIIEHAKTKGLNLTTVSETLGFEKTNKPA